MAVEDPFTLHPATREDIARLSDIHVIACLPDNAFKLYFETPAEFNRRVTEMLEGQVGEPTWIHIKVVDTATGTLAAWASWYTPSDDELRASAAKVDVIPDSKDEVAAASADEKMDDKNEGAKGGFDFPPDLPVYVNEDTERWLTRSTRQRRHMQCKALFTDPKFQRQGMGSALVQHGNAIADAAGLPIFLQASPYGFPVYHQFGFETTQYLDVDLCEWAPNARRGDKGFGNYRFRYMLRLPETLPEEGK